MSELTPIEIEVSVRLTFQRSVLDGRVRAVVKHEDGTVLAVSDPVPAERAEEAKTQALNRWKTRVFNASLGLPLDAGPEEQHNAVLRRLMADGLISPGTPVKVFRPPLSFAIVVKKDGRVLQKYPNIARLESAVGLARSYALLDPSPTYEVREEHSGEVVGGVRDGKTFKYTRKWKR